MEVPSIWLAKNAHERALTRGEEHEPGGSGAAVCA